MIQIIQEINYIRQGNFVYMLISNKIQKLPNISEVRLLGFFCFSRQPQINYPLIRCLKSWPKMIHCDISLKFKCHKFASLKTAENSCYLSFFSPNPCHNMALYA